MVFHIKKLPQDSIKKYFPRSSKYISEHNVRKYIKSENIPYNCDYNACCKLTDKQLEQRIVELLKEENYNIKELHVLLHTPESRIKSTLKFLGIKYTTPSSNLYSSRKLPIDENKKRMKLYKLGLTDGKIAEKCGTSAGAVLSWRNSRNLSSNFRKDYNLFLEKRMQLYNQGKSDTEISEIQNITMESVFGWRKSRNLVKNENLQLIRKLKHNQKLSLYLQGLEDKEIASKLNLSDITISLWRKHNSLKSNYKIKIAKQMSNRMKLYNQGKTDNEIATIQKVIIQSVAKWRKQHNLFPNKKNKRKSV